MRTVLLALLYGCVVTPLGLLGRVVRDPLRRRVDPKAPTYWVAGASRVGQGPARV
ncbi:hypothetical protein [Streptacidiphilus jiangxiensis]|uniref:Uncharacterized protein n=1 Tax=Streptacidiphilus jiangxiensis TaxID=235985 RepID=A0A1H7XMG0_STRJI|nr:hypothetical protein [Streptacidiphilus jiangxiensis]SEM34833.1 hypothetical protein SAMN05414137_124108 [Streptacidiphilus jiangxiensis]